MGLLSKVKGDGCKGLCVQACTGGLWFGGRCGEILQLNHFGLVGRLSNFWFVFFLSWLSKKVYFSELLKHYSVGWGGFEVSRFVSGFALLHRLKFEEEYGGKV